MSSASSPVSEYANVDFSPKGVIAQALHEGVEGDAMLGRISLQDRIGLIPADVTPAMRSFFGNYVAGRRQAALAQVEAALKSVADRKSATGIFYERECDKVEDERIRQKRATYAAHREKRSAEYKTLDERQESHLRAVREYDRLHQRHGRSPQMVSWWYWIALILIGATDVALNYEAILSVPSYTPAFATAAAIMIGGAIAAASHMHGTLVKQWSARFGKDRRDNDRSAAFWMFSLGTTCLAFTGYALFYFRSQYLADLIAYRAAVGGEAPNALQIIGGSLSTNALVWLVGVIIAFWVHDSDPEFPRALEEVRKKEASARALEARLSAPLHRDFERIEAATERELETLAKQEQSLGHIADHVRGRLLFDQVAQQDARVMALLEAYRVNLISRVYGREVRFERPGELDPEKTQAVDIETYAAMPLQIKYV